MSTIKNGQISQYCHFNNIIKGSGISFQSVALSLKHVRNVCHTAHQYMTKFYFDNTQHLKEINKCNFHHVAMPVVASQILKSVDFTQTQKSRYLENETFS